jgi:hypothetical protein
MNKKSPLKKNDKEIYRLITEKIKEKNYVFLKHAQERLRQRGILETDVIKILEGEKAYCRKRNKAKDTYAAVGFNEEAEDWKYCIEGNDIDQNPIRIIVTFDEDWMLIITVIALTGE